MNVKQKIFSTIASRIDLNKNKKVLLCYSDIFLYKKLKNRYPKADINFLQKDGVSDFMNCIDVPEEERYGHIVDMGLLEAYGWQSGLIRAMGRHLSDDGCFVFCFHSSVFGKCYGQNHISSYLDVVQIMYGNWFSPGGMLGFEADGSVVDIANWGGNRKSEFPFYMGWVREFDRETDWLQSFYTDDVRWELSCLLNRIEYDIDVEENTVKLAELCRTESIVAIYLERFVKSVACDVGRVRKILREAGIIGGR